MLKKKLPKGTKVWFKTSRIWKRINIGKKGMALSCSVGFCLMKVYNQHS